MCDTPLSKNVLHEFDNGIAGSFLLYVRKWEIPIVVFQSFSGFDYLLVVVVIRDVAKCPVVLKVFVEIGLIE